MPFQVEKLHVTEVVRSLVQVICGQFQGAKNRISRLARTDSDAKTACQFPTRGNQFAGSIWAPVLPLYG